MQALPSSKEACASSRLQLSCSALHTDKSNNSDLIGRHFERVGPGITHLPEPIYEVARI